MACGKKGRGLHGATGSLPRREGRCLGEGFGEGEKKERRIRLLPVRAAVGGWTAESNSSIGNT
jgi:hypothetical protein